MIRVGQGSEFVSRDLELWAYQRSITLDFSRPGKPTDNAFIKSFNGKFRAECLNAHWFMSLDDARRKCEAWRRDYNEERPHSAIGNKAPIEPHRSISGARPALRNARKKSAGRSKDGEQFRGKPSQNRGPKKRGRSRPSSQRGQSSGTELRKVPTLSSLGCVEIVLVTVIADPTGSVYSFQAPRPPRRMSLALPLLQELQCRDSGFVQSPAKSTDTPQDRSWELDRYGWTIKITQPDKPIRVYAAR